MSKIFVIAFVASAVCFYVAPVLSLAVLAGYFIARKFIRS